MRDSQLRAIGQQIRKARKSRGWTQEDLAGKLGITRQTLLAMEKGHGNRPNLERLERLSELTGYSLPEFLSPTLSTIPPSTIVEEQQLPPQIVDIAKLLTAFPSEHQERAIRIITALLSWYEMEFLRESGSGT